MKKEKLKQRDPYKYYRNCYAACTVGEYACILAPVGAVFGAKWQEYFSVVDGNQVKMTIGCILSLLVAAIVVFKKIKHTEKVNDTPTMLSFVIGVGLAFVLSFLFKVVVDDLTLILGAEFAGSAAAYGIDFATIHNKTMKDAYKKAEVELATREAAVRTSQRKSGRLNSILNERNGR